MPQEGLDVSQFAVSADQWSERLRQRRQPHPPILLVRSQARVQMSRRKKRCALGLIQLHRVGQPANRFWVRRLMHTALEIGDSPSAEAR